MSIGAFSISLAVKDIEQSKLFYQKLGFNVIGGEQSQNWLIMRNGDNSIGLFQGMFESNIMTFNPGWDKDCQPLESFTDVRQLLAQFKSQGVDITSESVENSSGPANFTMVDPDGNAILIDQHV